MDSPLFDSFKAYFDRDLAQQAAGPLANGVEIEFQIRTRNGQTGEITTESFFFTKEAGRNVLKPGRAQSPQILFTLTPEAARAVLEDPAQDIGTIGIGIAKLIVSSDPERKISVSLRTGFMTLFSKGYLGVIAAGGTHFAGYLASRGLNGIASLQAAIQKLRKDRD